MLLQEELLGCWELQTGKSEEENPQQTQRTGISTGLLLPGAGGRGPSAEKSLRANNGGWAEIKHRGCCADNFHIKGDE